MRGGEVKHIFPSGPRGTRALSAIVLGALAVAAAPCRAEAAGRAALIIDANTGQDLHVHDADRPLYPASLTKMMTLYIVFDLMEQKRVSTSTKIQITPRCAGMPPSNLELEAGAAIPLREAVLALIVKSANDVACAIGENLAGSEDQFARIMTSKARQLGMHATTFRNASGLPDPAQVTTARDLATLAMRLAHDFPEHYKLFATREFSFNGHTHRSHNGLLHGFEGTDGIKTGYTRASGFNLVSSVRRGQKHVIGVVLGGVTAAQRNSTMRALLTQGLGRAKAMARPLLVRRPAPVAEPARPPEKAPVPRRVAEQPAAPTPTPTPVAARPPVVQAAILPQKSPPPAPVAAVAPAGSGPGRPPATLQDQAAGKARAVTAVAAAPGLAPVSPGARPAGLGARPAGVPGAAPAAGPFHIQIGAFSNETEAQRQLAAVSGRAGAVVAGHAPVTVPVAKDNLQFYRARFAGFSEAAAQSACQSLKAQKFECLVMRAQ